MSNPLVSVIVPTYKRTDYLKLTLESVKNQTFQDFEVIVIDDGTPNDDNLILCSTFEKVKYIKIENSAGPAKPRNVGIKEAKGKYIAFVDDDDLWLSTKLEKQVAILDNNPEFGLVHSCCEVIDENGIKTNEIVGRPGSPDIKHGDVSLKMMGNWTLMMPTPMVRKKVIDKVGFFNEIMPPAGEDVEYWTRCSFITKIFYIDEPLALYRRHSENISKYNPNYFYLSKYMKWVLQDQLFNNRINKFQYKFLIDNLCRLQIKELKTHTVISICNLFMLNPFWILKWNHLKLLVFIIIKR